MIKYNEALSIKKTYAVIFKRLSDERVAYEQNLTQIEKALANKNTDFEKLIAMSKEAAVAREVANRKLQSYKQNPGQKGVQRGQDPAALSADLMHDLAAVAEPGPEDN
mgnify:CR=1 FL=1